MSSHSGNSPPAASPNPTIPDAAECSTPTSERRSIPPATSAQHQSSLTPQDPGSSNRGLRATPVYRIPIMPEPAKELASSAVAPGDIFRLFRCPCCNDRLEAPTTLRCGHTVCSAHVTLSADDIQPVPLSRSTTSVSSSSQASISTGGTGSDGSSHATAPLLPSCPLDDCLSHSSSHHLSSIMTLPPSSRVTYYPPPMSATSSTASLASTAAASSSRSSTRPRRRVASPKQDITVGKILQLTLGAVHHRERRERNTARAQSAVGDDTDDEGEDDDPTPPSGHTPIPCQPSFYPPLPIAPPSSSHRSTRSHSPPTDPSETGSPSARRTKRRRTSRSQSLPPLPPTGEVDPKFTKDLFAELQCEICFSMLYNPLTTPCQHTFCSKCLSRTLDHSVQCPLCRQDLPGFAYFHEHATNKVIQSILVYGFPEVLADRKAAIEEEECNARLDTPIFVCQLSFPGLPTILHVFEPRYRLMLRRCLQRDDHEFGMIMPPRANMPSEADEYGTMLEIRSVQMLPDGRSMVETRGTHRFRIVERGYFDGYLVARIQRIDDCSPQADELLEEAMVDNNVEPSVEELMQTCRDFYEQLKTGSAPWVVQQLNNAYGSMPEDSSTFSYWMAMLLPIDENEKAKLLPIRSPRLRLKLLVHWIESLNNSWWFGQGCAIV